MIKFDYSELQKELNKYIAEKISYAELKHTTAPFGIYQQRNDLFMIRIRIVGGQAEATELKIISKVMKDFGVAYAHFTTRQDIQLHDVKPEKILNIVEALSRQGIPFRGGGGNTFRNIIVSSDSGISQNSVFDVYPYAKALNEFMMNYDKAFDLPRKLKIGFASSSSDCIHADLQDLGFIAKEDRSGKGFEVFAGGGMGRKSRYGIRLFNFLPDNKVKQCAKAITDLFYDHGDRENRQQARLRFVLDRLGDDRFKKLFQDYYLQSAVDQLKIKKIDYNKKCSYLEEKSYAEESENAFDEWKNIAVSETCFGDDVVSVKIFIPKGIFKAVHFEKLHEILELTGSCFVRFCQSQDIIIPIVKKNSLRFLYKKLKQNFDDIDITFNSFNGHVLSCVGASVCKIGIVEAPKFADAVSRRLDKYFLGNPMGKAEFIKTILPDIKISGCLNSCSGHFSAKMGITGIKRRVNGHLIEGAMIKQIGGSEEEFVALEELPEAIFKALSLPDHVSYQA